MKVNVDDGNEDDRDNSKTSLSIGKQKYYYAFFKLI